MLLLFFVIFFLQERHLHEHPDNNPLPSFNVFDTILKLRCSRVGMVQTKVCFLSVFLFFCNLFLKRINSSFAIGPFWKSIWTRKSGDVISCRTAATRTRKTRPDKVIENMCKEQKSCCMTLESNMAWSILMPVCSY
jgi:hypothetical protein